MAQSLTERMTAAERLLDVNQSRLGALKEEVELLYDQQAEATRDFADLKREFDRETALLKREVEDLKAWREEWKRGSDELGRRVWMIVPPIVAAVVSSALTGFITYFIRR